MGVSTTEFNVDDWLEPMANDIVNRLIQYFETIRSQTERDIYAKGPIAND